METYTFLLSAIGSVGFPIVACGIMFYLYKHTIDSHATESKEITAAINALTIAINEIKARLDR